MYGQQQQPMYPGAGHRNVGGGGYSTGGGFQQQQQQPGGFGMSHNNNTSAAQGAYTSTQKDDHTKPARDMVAVAIRWLKTRNDKEKMMLGVGAGILTLLLLWVAIEDHDFLFVLSETCHFVGIGLLIYKLLNKKSCIGISLRSQELTLIFLGVRMYCSFMMEYDVHTILDTLTFLATAWVVYSMYVPLAHTYQRDLDTVHTLYVAGPCFALACLIHPKTSHIFIHRVLWAVCVYIESVSVFPQLKLMQKNKVVERFTGHYVFALGIARFFSCAHWILQIMDGNSFITSLWSYGLWPILVLVSEIVQTFILADFCYYYVKSYADGSGVVRLPENVV